MAGRFEQLTLPRGRPCFLLSVRKQYTRRLSEWITLIASIASFPSYLRSKINLDARHVNKELNCLPIAGKCANQKSFAPKPANFLPCTCQAAASFLLCC